MTRIRDRGRRKGPSHGGPRAEPVLYLSDGTCVKPYPTGVYFIPPGTYTAPLVLDLPYRKGRSFSVERQ